MKLISSAALLAAATVAQELRNLQFTPPASLQDKLDDLEESQSQAESSASVSFRNFFVKTLNDYFFCRV